MIDLADFGRELLHVEVHGAKGRNETVMFSLMQECGCARLGRLATQRGTLTTPAMLLSVRKGDLHGLTPEEIHSLGHLPGIILNPFDLCEEG